MTIEHIAVYVRDLEQSTSFFETYFNGKRVSCITIKERDFLHIL